MRIRRLKLTGFKSFVEPAELLIEPGLTGIVGPNGCGKSNLLEAIRWVMGEGSPKSLRGAAMEDVIFAGTDRRPARDFAEVTILTERDPAPDDPDQDREREIVRRIERGAGSAYRLNGRDVRARDVALLFADAATGAHSPALVSQGRIAAVIAAKPAERRQMLEEAAGIAGLHVRRKDAEVRMRATEANLERLDALIAEQEARCGALRRQARSAERYRRLSDAIRVAEARLIHARWRDAAEAAAAARSEAAEAEAEVTATGEAARAAGADKAEAARTLAERRHAAQVTREAAQAAAARLATLRGERAALVRRIAELAAQATALAQDRAREDDLAEDAATALAALGEEENALTSAIGEAAVRRGPAAEAVRAAERAARDADVAAAQCVATSATEAAERRVADAARAAAAARAERAGTAFARVTADLAAVGDGDALDAAIVAARVASEAAAREREIAATALAQSEAARADAAAARDAAQSAASAAKAAGVALESEARALARALEGGGSRALAAVRAMPGYEHALAAALGDDLDAGLGEGARRWTGAAARENDPALPAGIDALAAQVSAPDALARRLRQIGVVDADDGSIMLAVGQRLVTRDGRLRRWDGFVADSAGAAAAERLTRANRLAELETALPQARDAAMDAAQQMMAAEAALVVASAALGVARTARDAAEARLREAGRAEDVAMLARERMAARHAALGDARTAAVGERTTAAVALTEAVRALDALPDGTDARAAVDEASEDAARARALLTVAQGALAALEQAMAHDGRRIEAARGEARGWRARAGDAAKRVTELRRRGEAIAGEQALLADAPERAKAVIVEAERVAEEAGAAAKSAQPEEACAEAAARAAEAAYALAGEAQAAARERRAGAAARAEHQEARRIELGRVAGERFQCPAPLLAERIGFDPAVVREAGDESREHDRLLAERERLGPVNLVAESELAEIEAARAANAGGRDELGQAINRLRGSIGSLNREGRARLLAAFEAVDGHFRTLFRTLFAGGEAHLALVDADDPLEAGLEIMAQPPGKKLASLTLLSGGEQALTAVALIFALFLTNPAPICVLDEVDAPLDDANVERFCDLLDRMVADTGTRYLIVTHNPVTMARMHRLFGVTMIERGVSRLVSVDLARAGLLLAAE